MSQRPSFLFVHRFCQTPACRLRLDRRTSDLTDDEWVLVAPLIPPAKRGDRGREVVVREVVNGIMYCCPPAASGWLCPRICRPEARYGPIWICGAGMARWGIFIMGFRSERDFRDAKELGATSAHFWNAASMLAVMPAPQLPLSTVKA